MEPFSTIIAHVNVVLRNSFRMPRKRHPRFIIAAHVFGILIALRAVACATSVVVLIDYDRREMIIAADSMERQLVRTSTGVIKERVAHVCKIFDWPVCVVSMAGIVTNAPASLNVPALAASACKESGTLREKADYFLQVAQSKIINISPNES
jgi:hypothetical protein